MSSPLGEIENRVLKHVLLVAHVEDPQAVGK